MPCPGDRDQHCCWLAGRPCPFLEEGTVEGRRWACGLRRELGSWDAVHDDPRYLSTVAPEWAALPPFEDGTPVIISCGDWPTPRNPCGTCGAKEP